MLTATKPQAIAAIDRYAIQAAADAIVVFDCTASVDRMKEHLQNTAVLYADRLCDGGVDIFAAQAAADHFLQAALWCLTSRCTLPEEIVADAIARAGLIYQLAGEERTAIQCAEFAALTAAMEVLDGPDLREFTARVQRAVSAVVAGPAGNA